MKVCHTNSSLKGYVVYSDCVVVESRRPTQVKSVRSSAASEEYKRQEKRRREERREEAEQEEEEEEEEEEEAETRREEKQTLIHISEPTTPY